MVVAAAAAGIQRRKAGAGRGRGSAVSPRVRAITDRSRPSAWNRRAQARHDSRCRRSASSPRLAWAWTRARSERCLTSLLQASRAGGERPGRDAASRCPVLRPSAVAISGPDQPSRWRRTKTSRWRSGSDRNASQMRRCVSLPMAMSSGVGPASTRGTVSTCSLQRWNRRHQPARRRSWHAFTAMRVSQGAQSSGGPCRPCASSAFTNTS